MTAVRSVVPRFVAVALPVLLLFGALILTRPLVYPDLVQDYAAGWARWHGHDPDGATRALLTQCCPEAFPPKADPSPERTAHPPFATAVVLPLTLLPWEVARVVWLVIGWIAIVVAWRVSRLPLLAQLATVTWWMDGLAMGTVEPLVLLCLALAICWESRRSTWAGVFVGVAAALKIYPGLLIVGLWLAGKRRSAIAATIAGAICVLIGEAAIGVGSTLAWARYMPINTALYIDVIHNLSLPHLIRVILPSTPAATASLIAIAALTLPLWRRVTQQRAWNALLPVMLLGSPLCWGQYLPLVTLNRVGRVALVLLGVSGLVDVLSIVGVAVVPSGIPFALLMIIFPTLALLTAWYGEVRAQTRRSRTIVRSAVRQVRSP